MTFSILVMCIQVIDHYFDTELYRYAETYAIQRHHHLYETIIQNYFYQFPNTNLSKSTELHLQNTRNQLWIYSIGHKMALPIPMWQRLFPNAIPQLYYTEGSHMYAIHDTNRKTPLQRASLVSDYHIQHQWFRTFRFDHPLIKNLTLMVTINMTDIHTKKQWAYLIIVITLFIVSSLLIALFNWLLKNITRTVSEIIDVTKKIGSGQLIPTMKVRSNDELGFLAQGINTMIINTKQQTDELIFEKNRSKLILSQFPDAIIITDLNYKLVMANRAAETMLTFSTDRAKGQNILKYIKNENFVSLFSNHSIEDESTSLCREISIPDGPYKKQFYHITMSPIIDANAKKMGLITVIRNITKEHQSRTIKNTILRTIIQELKTPLTSIMGFINILQKEYNGALNPKQHDCLNISSNNAIILKNHINNLLNITILYSGDYTVHMEWFCLTTLFTTVVDYLGPNLRKKYNILHIQTTPDPLFISADKQKIRQIIQHLVSSIHLLAENTTIHCNATQTTHACKIIIQTDTVIYLPNQIRLIQLSFEAKLFAILAERIDVSFIELAIVLELVHIHNGTITCCCNESEGTAFTISLPQQADNVAN